MIWEVRYGYGASEYFGDRMSAISFAKRAAETTRKRSVIRGLEDRWDLWVYDFQTKQALIARRGIRNREVREIIKNWDHTKLDATVVPWPSDRPMPLISA